MTMMLLPDLPVLLMDDSMTKTPSSFSQLRGNKAMVIDFWHTKCTRCPAALDKLNSEAEKAGSKDIVFVSCALSQGEGNYEIAADLVTDGALDSLLHVFMGEETKDAAKATFGYTAVPFFVVVDTMGNVIGSGEPKSCDYKALIAQSEKEVEPVAVPVVAGNTFSLEEDF